jgi:hypothetical protein
MDLIRCWAEKSPSPFAADEVTLPMSRVIERLISLVPRYSMASLVYWGQGLEPKRKESGTVSKKAQKPLYGMLLSVVGGIIILVASVLKFVGTTFIFGGFELLPGYSGPIGVIMGILIVAFALSKRYMPKYKNLFAILIMILAILNILLGFDFLIIGAILAIVGAIMGYMGR